MSYSPFRHLPAAFYGRRPVHLTLFLTRRCNSRCRFCFYLPGKSMNRAASAAELSIREIGKISASLGSLLWLAFSGGEPFLRKDLPEIARLFYERNRPCIILIPTNGLETESIVRNTEEILRTCRKSTVAVKLSLDGPEDVHDRLRGVAGAYRRTIETFGRLRDFLGKYPNFELGVNSVFCSENQDVIGGLIDEVRKMDGVRTHTVSLIRGEVAEGRLKNINPEAYAGVADRLAEDLRTRAAATYRFSGARLKAAQDILQRKLIHRTIVGQARQVACLAGRLSLVLTETGDAWPCESFSIKMGNVRDYGCDASKLLESGEARKAARSIAETRCFCTHECNMMMNILFNPSLYPRLLREYLGLMRSSGSTSRPSSPAGRTIPRVADQTYRAANFVETEEGACLREKDCQGHNLLL